MTWWCLHLYRNARPNAILFRLTERIPMHIVIIVVVVARRLLLLVARLIDAIAVATAVAASTKNLEMKNYRNVHGSLIFVSNVNKINEQCTLRQNQSVFHFNLRILPLRRKNPLKSYVYVCFFLIRNALNAPSELMKLWCEKKSMCNEK